jgi:hypothetical protein
MRIADSVVASSKRSVSELLCVVAAFSVKGSKKLISLDVDSSALSSVLAGTTGAVVCTAAPSPVITTRAKHARPNLFALFPITPVLNITFFLFVLSNEARRNLPQSK